MNTFIARFILFLVFGAMLVTPVLLQQLGEDRSAPPGDPEATVARYGLSLEEVAKDVGVTFVHHAPQLDSKLDHIMPQIASVGAAVAVVDIDRDGWQDFYVTNSAEGMSNALYLNQRDGTFEDRAQVLGLADVNQRGTGVSMGSVWGDYDNDGFEDVLLYKWGRPELFHNDGGTGFTRSTDGSGLPAWMNANTAVWLDFDRDGALDLFVGGYFPEYLNLWRLETTRIMPESFEYAHNGGGNYLFRNLGDGTFEDVSQPMGLTSTRWTLAAAAVDLRGTGYPDLVIANDYGVDEVYFNESGRRFIDAGEQTRIGFAPKSGMSVSFGDVWNEGRYAIYVSNISEPGVLMQGNNLWVPETEGSRRFTNFASTLGVELGGWSYGVQFGDLNNDGALDLYLANGYVSEREDTDYWYDMSKVAGGNAWIISDAKNWPAMDGRSFSGYQKTRVWLNDGSGHFKDAAAVVGAADTYDGRAVALVDLWNRGVLDVLVANQRGPLLIYKNTVDAENRWISFELEGSASNRSAIGAQVLLVWNGRRQVQSVSGASGFAAQNDRRIHFGLGTHDKVDRVQIRWPSGLVQNLEAPEPNRLHRIKEPT